MDETQQPPLRVTPSCPGRVVCLCCQREFGSPDRTRVRICDKCKKTRERCGVAGERDYRVHGIDFRGSDGTFFDYSASSTAAPAAAAACGNGNGTPPAGEGELAPSATPDASSRRGRGRPPGVAAKRVAKPPPPPAKKEEEDVASALRRAVRASSWDIR